jgi:hypothetical protein
MPKIRFGLLVLICAGLCFVWASRCWAGVGHSTPKVQLPAYSESVLYNFCEATGCADGAMPSYGNLILGSDGNLYGVTSSGGNLVHSVELMAAEQSSGSLLQVSLRHCMRSAASLIAAMVFSPHR